MSLSVERLPGAGSLVRTTLLVDTGVPADAVAAAIAALHRVPGVLLAEAGPVTGRVLVAHDPGVPMASLVAAAAGPGALASPRVDAGPILAHEARSRQMRPLPQQLAALAAGALLVVLGAFDVAVRGDLDKRWLPILIVWPLCMLVVFGARADRRR
jgi:hypothetical protein